MQTMEFVNYKNTPNFRLDLKGSGLYAIKGRNKAGKTSILNGIEYAFKALDPTLKATNINHEKGQNTFNLTNDDSEIEIIEEHQQDTKTKFKMILDGDIQRKVSDIRDLFKYTSFTAESFIAMSNSKDGRKKQKEIILNLLDLDDKVAFYELEEKEKTAYDERRLVNSKIKDIESSLVSNSLTEEELESLKTYDKVVEWLTKLSNALNNLDATKKEKENLISGKELFNSNIDAALLSFKNNFDENALEGFYEIIDKANELYTEKIESISIDDPSSIEEKIEKGNAKLSELNKLNTQKAIYDEKEIEQTKYLKSQKKLNDDLDLTRSELRTFFDDKDLPIKELILKSDDEGLFIKTKDGELPFNDKQMSTSTMMYITLKIMFLVNETTPILLLGKLESFDDNSLESIVKFAEENECQIIADKVTNDDNLIFELITSKGSEELLKIKANDVIDIEKQSIVKPKKEKKKKEEPKKVIKKKKEDVKNIKIQADNASDVEAVVQEEIPVENTKPKSNNLIEEIPQGLF